MKHTMKLNDAPYAMIKSGRKTIELRLYDEKRQAIAVGDEIEFCHRVDPTAALLCRVIALHRFASFEELYKTLPLIKCGYTVENVSAASAADMELYYSKEEQAAYGVIGIEIELIG
jgi:ASC-1-like (ASCH) protein